MDDNGGLKSLQQKSSVELALALQLLRETDMMAR